MQQGPRETGKGKKPEMAGQGAEAHHPPSSEAHLLVGWPLERFLTGRRMALQQMRGMTPCICLRPLWPCEPFQSQDSLRWMARALSGGWGGLSLWGTLWQVPRDLQSTPGSSSPNARGKEAEGLPPKDKTVPQDQLAGRTLVSLGHQTRRAGRDATASLSLTRHPTLQC